MILILLFCICRSYDDPTVITVFNPGDDGSMYYRIPSIVVAANGSLVTATDKRKYKPDDIPNIVDIVVKTSHDGGLTWGPSKVIASGNPKGYCDSSLVVDRETGNIILLFNGNNGFFNSTSSDPIRNYITISKDNGETWTEPRDITYMLYGDECDHYERKTWEAMFLSSGKTLQLKSGRIIVIGVVRKKGFDSFFNYAVYSDDGGENWDVGITSGCTNGDEAKVVELNNGDVMMTVRHKPYRYMAISHDKGLTFDDFYERKDMPDPAVNGEIIRYTSKKDGYDKDRILFVNDHNSVSKLNATIKLSYDEGKTWAFSKVFHAGDAWYSTLCIKPDGTIAVYYERYNNGFFYMDVVLMSLEWITDDADKYIPPNPNKIKK